MTRKSFYLGIWTTYFLAFASLSLLTNDFPFIYDDRALLEDHQAVQSKDLKAIWTRPHWEGINAPVGAENLHRPLFLSLLAVSKSFPDLLRTLPLLLHFSLSLILFLLLMKEVKDTNKLTLQDLWIGFISGLFLFHPANVEVFIQVIGLMDQIPLFLGLFAIIWSSAYPLMGLAAAAVAPGWKETGYISLAFLSFCFFHRGRWGLLSLAILIGLIWLGLRANIYESLFGFPDEPYALLNPMVEFSLWERFWSILSLIGQHIRLTFFPFPLTSDYSRGSLPLPGYPIQIWVLLFFLATGLVIKYYRHLTLPVTFAFFVTLPTLHLSGNIGIVFAERFGYGFRLAMLLFIGRVVLKECQPLMLRKLSISEMRSSIRAGVAVAMILISLFFTGTLQRSLDWSSGKTLFETDLQSFPYNAKLHTNLGIVYGGRSEWEKAKQHLSRSIQLAPDFPEAHYRLGLVYRKLGDDALAQRHFQIADQLGINGALLGK